MRDTGKYSCFVVCALVFLVFCTAQSMADGTFAGLPQPGQVLGNNGTAAAPAAPVPVFGHVAPSGIHTQLYASPAAQGAGNCLDAADACTLPAACAFRTQVSNFISGPFLITLAAGSYPSTTVDSLGNLCTILGNNGGSSPTLTQLNGGSPSSVTLNGPSNGSVVSAKDSGEVQVFHVTITCGNSCTGINNQGQGAVSDYNDVTWGTWGTGGSHVAVSGGGYANVGGTGETLATNFTYHWNLSGNAILSSSGPTNIPSTISWTGGSFAVAGGPSILELGSWSLTGAGVSGSTGQRAILTGPGYMITPGSTTPCNSLFPGNVACALSLGFQDSAGEGIAQIAQGGTGANSAPGAMANLMVGAVFTTPITVNFGVTGDNAIPIVLPSGFTQVRVNGVTISQCGATLSRMQFGLNTATGGGGAAIITSGSTSTVTNNTVNTANNYQLFNTINNINTEAYTPSGGNLQLRVGNPAGTNPTNCSVALQFFPTP